MTRPRGPSRFVMAKADAMATRADHRHSTVDGPLILAVPAAGHACAAAEYLV
jgi:hypothetical protein